MSTSDDGVRTRSELARRGIDRPDRDRDARWESIRRGVYVHSNDASPSVDARFLLKVRAAARTLAPGTIFSHESAAALLGLPILGPWPDSVDVLAERASGGRTQLDVRRHCVGLEGVRVGDVDGVRVTSPARAVFDLSLSRSFMAAVVTADAFLRLYPAHREELLDLRQWHGQRRGYLKLGRVLDFANGLAGSPGESISRVAIAGAGFEAPVLRFAVVTGAITEFTDFAWPGAGAVGEFDGEAKYREDRYRRGGTAEDVVIREKNRENRIRRTMPVFIRWDMRDLRTPHALERLLDQAGIPRV